MSDQELKESALQNFIHSGALATNQCPNYLRDAYFKEGFKAACRVKNIEIQKRDALIESAKIFISNSCDPECFDLRENDETCRHDDWLKNYEAINGK